LKNQIKKIIKYIVAGSFLFFLIKGLIWLAVFILAWLGFINFF
tara:strand:- start:694 stop:822 length:129 start_codon:yes stop_codon:yes gene_type:complete